MNNTKVYVDKDYKIYNFIIYKFKMAFLTDDSSFTHVIAIDFGTGASG